LTDETKSGDTTKNGEVGSVSRACKILHLLERHRQSLRLTDIARLTALDKATCHRILATLVAHGLAGRTPTNEYVGMIQRAVKPAIRIGYAAQTEEFAFSRIVSHGIKLSAAKAGIELILCDNAYSPTVALRNADLLIKQNVQLVIEFQTDASMASVISAKLQAKRIPLIAIEIPHPNSVYFGVNNIQAGLTGGRHLGRWAGEHWRGRIDALVLLGLSIAGSFPGSRMTGTLLGVREVMPDFSDDKVKILDGNGQHGPSFEVVRQFLRSNDASRVLVGAINDPSALGALQAFRDLGREQHCAIVGQNASSDAVEEMQSPFTRLIGSVGYFPEKYGEQIIKLAIDMIQGTQTPSAVFVKHHMVTPANVKLYYPQSGQKRAVSSKMQLRGD
jgi:ribose transport system substrate-binding protein